MSKDRIPRLVPGTQLYKYQLVRRVGGGSFGEVWFAHDRAIGSDCAVKILRPGMPIDERLREAELARPR